MENTSVEQRVAEKRIRCRRCGALLQSPQFMNEITAILAAHNQDYSLDAEHGRLECYCPTCKRLLRGQAYFHILGKSFI